MNICFTGPLHYGTRKVTREQAKLVLQYMGHAWHRGVMRTTDLLVVGDVVVKTAKQVAAERYHCRTISASQLFDVAVSMNPRSKAVDEILGVVGGHHVHGGPRPSLDTTPGPHSGGPPIETPSQKRGRVRLRRHKTS